MIIYKDLQPGEYRFNVTAANCDGFWNHSGAALTFRIKSPFHKTTWFFFIIIFTIYIFSPFIYRRIKTGLKKTTEEINKYKTNLTFQSPLYEKELFAKDTTDLKEKRERWHQSLSQDVYVEEALNVLEDLKTSYNIKKVATINK